MDPERQDLERILSSWNDETLIEELALGEQEYRPEALEVMRAELGRRGLSESEISREVAEEKGEAEVPEEKLVAVAWFANRFFGLMARGLLDSHGIPAYLGGSDEAFFGEGPDRLTTRRVFLQVAAHDEAKARELLAEAEGVLKES